MDLWKKIGSAIRYRLVLEKLTQRVLLRLGIKLEFYYWTQEGLAGDPPQEQGCDLKDYTFSAFGADEMRTIASLTPWRHEDILLRHLPDVGHGHPQRIAVNRQRPVEVFNNDSDVVYFSDGHDAPFLVAGRLVYWYIGTLADW